MYRIASRTVTSWVSRQHSTLEVEVIQRSQIEGIQNAVASAIARMKL
jgi:hypothetical protein